MTDLDMKKENECAFVLQQRKNEFDNYMELYECTWYDGNMEEWFN